MPAHSNRHNIQAVVHSGAGMKISMEGGRHFPLGPSASRAAFFISWAPGALPLQLAGRPVLIKGFGRPRKGPGGKEAGRSPGWTLKSVGSSRCIGRLAWLGISWLGVRSGHDGLSKVLVLSFILNCTSMVVGWRLKRKHLMLWGSWPQWCSWKKGITSTPVSTYTPGWVGS